jgi:diguanylate cyclase (GGDEF)-like protein
MQNRRQFDETFDKELNRARRYGQSLSLVTLDLHRFKEVNDKYGHPRGDEVLRAAAATLKKALRTSDTAFRIGGDEFALLLPQTDSAQASALSRRIGVVFAEVLRPLELEISVAMDHGVATYPQDGDQRAQLIRISDEQLYRSKHATHAGKESSASEAPSVVPPTEPLPVPTPPAPEVSAPPTESAASVLAAAFDVPSAEAAPGPEEKKPSAAAPAKLSSALEQSKPTFPEAPPEPKLYAIPRKAERVSMAGTNAYALLGNESEPRARVVDLGFGGVALDFPSVEGLADTLFAVLHVPILPPVRVNLKRVWTKQISESTFRVGCCFVS